MLTAFTRAISPAMNRCELVYLERQAIEVEKAAAQHRAYEECLQAMGCWVTTLPAEADLPDAVFVEDPAVVLDEVAVMTRMGAESRRRESESLAKELETCRSLRWLREPATLEGGDVMRVERTLYVGESARTNTEGIRQLAEAVGEFGYKVVPVTVPGCMHLKTGCSYLGFGMMLANREWVDVRPLAGFEILDVPREEAWAANVLRVEDRLLMPDAFPVTAGRLRRRGWDVRTVDISEFLKAEAGVTCMSLLLE